ncbi:hypothetical protein NCC78_12630 [Micromonospora phytophila]|uniref:hypothetical protein n=1 Tax=Micromonospora phytophila TaxID=709888 RepID=UPI00202E6604|nr:hypothetical protein [Micromonospora phytophila]MCM0675530.1 hypothetical protein [Micromonospora phytophila]
MKTRGAATAVALALTLTGCGVVRDIADRSPNPAPSPTVSSAEILVRAAEALENASYSYQFRTPDVIGAGAVDGEDGWLRIRLIGDGLAKRRLTFEVLHVDEHYLARSNPLTADRWTRLDIRKMDPARRRVLEEFGDPARARELFAGIAVAEPVGERSYRGALDLTKVTNPADSRLIQEEHLTSLSGDQAANVPFEASVDGQGRLLGFRFTLPASGSEPEHPSEISYSEHGFSPDLRGPLDGEIATAPAGLYEILNA